VGRVPRAHAARELPREYRPWSMQRKFHRSRAPIRCVVAGRQAGKTHAAAEEVVRLVLSRPLTESCLLMPTYKSTKAALRHLRRAVAVLGKRVRWKEADKCFVFRNGALLYVRTAEDKEGVPTAGSRSTACCGSTRPRTCRAPPGRPRA
jgi:phage terminase large subunit-like protein